MNKCKLCLKADATQTGSHIVSCFIVNTMLGERDNEDGYLISSEGGNYRENLQAKGIKEDYIFCHGCELRLSYLEGYFSSEFTNKVDKDRYKENFPIYIFNSTSYCKPTKINTFAFHLLINSVLWRAHLSTKQVFKNYRIPESAAEQIRLTLDTVLPEYKNYKVKGKYSAWISDLEAIKELINVYPYVMFRTELKGQDLTENFIYFNSYDKAPYHHIINEFIILTFFNDGQSEFKQDDFDLQSNYNLNYLLNSSLDSLKIGVLKYNDSKIIRRKLFKRLLAKLENDCKKEAIQLGFIPNREYINNCVKNKLK